MQISKISANQNFGRPLGKFELNDNSYLVSQINTLPPREQKKAIELARYIDQNSDGLEISFSPPIRYLDLKAGAHIEGKNFSEILEPGIIFNRGILGLLRKTKEVVDEQKREPEAVKKARSINQIK